MSRLARLEVLGLFSLLLVLSFALSCDDGGGGGGGGDGSGFGVSGRMANLGVKGSKAPATVIADYVYAVNTCPPCGSEWRKKALIGPDGSFTIDLTKGDPWVLAFIDSSQVGSDMIQGIFGAEELDCIAPETYDSDDSTDVGDIVVDEFGDAPMDPVNYDTFVGNLGMELVEAATLGLLDDLMLRYINPDMDGNGILDMDDPDMPALDLSIGQNYRYGDSALLTYIQAGQDLPTDGSMTYLDGGAQMRFDSLESGVYSMMPPKWSLGWTDAGNYGGPNPAVFTGAVADPGGDFYMNMNFPAAVTDVPDGTYTYKLYANEADVDPSATLTFTNVKTMDDATVTTNFVFPFPVFDVDGNGDVTTISYTWMKKKAAGFVPATSGDIEMVVGKNRAELLWFSLPSTGNYSKVILIPYEEDFAPAGTIILDPGDWRVTICPDVSPKRADIGTVGTTFVSKLGLWVGLLIE